MSRPNNVEHLHNLASLKEGQCLSNQYVKNSTKYTWKCKNNHIFEASALSVNNGSWCKYCYYEKRKGLFKITIKELNETAKLKNGKCLSIEYKGTDHKCLWQCENDHTWEATFNNVKSNNSWCPYCDPSAIKNIEHLTLAASQKKGFLLDNEYKGVDSKYQWKCQFGHTWFASGSSVVKGNWCAECSGLKKKTIDFCNEMAQKHKGKCLSTEYINSKTKMLWECENGHQFVSKLNYVISGNWCRYCKMGSIEELQKIALSKEGKCLSSIYTNSGSDYNFKCKNEHVWKARGSSITSGTWCPSCPSSVSKPQNEIFEYIKSILFNEKVLLSDRSAIKTKEGTSLELDIYVPSKNFALEYNGLFWHSAAIETVGKTYKKGSHLIKFRACKSVGIKLLAIFEDEWENPIKKNLIKAMIKHRLGISDGIKLYARKLELKKLNKNNLFKDFFNKYHLDGHSNASFAYGLFLNDTMVSCMSLRTNHQGEAEICRFANDYNYRVIGGAGRLVKAIKKEIGEKPLITFSNNRLSHGEVYQKLGFSLLQENDPSYYYTDLKVRLWRYKCRRINKPEIISEFPTERSQARGGVFSKMYLGHNRPLYEIEDYGHLKWILK